MSGNVDDDSDDSAMILDVDFANTFVIKMDNRLQLFDIL